MTDGRRGGGALAMIWQGAPFAAADQRSAGLEKGSGGSHDRHAPLVWLFCGFSGQNPSGIVAAARPKRCGDAVNRQQLRRGGCLIDDISDIRSRHANTLSRSRNAECARVVMMTPFSIEEGAGNAGSPMHTQPSVR
jgi:hypothetical protein